METLTKDKLTQKESTFPILGIDHIELYVGNAKQAAHYFKSAFGFQSLAYAGLETGRETSQSYVITQGDIKWVLTSPVVPDSTIGKHLDRHGDGVKIVAFTVEDATQSYQQAIERGASSYLEPTIEEDSEGVLVKSGIHTYGNAVHVFVERKQYQGIFMPGFQSWTSHYNPSPVGLLTVDHLVGNVDWNEMNQWVSFYEEVLGFQQIISFDDEDISTEYTALMSKVMSNGNGRVKFPINEPAKGKKKSQVEEYLHFHGGPGVQHIALATENIVQTIHDLKERGVDFLKVPRSYYDDLSSRIGLIDEDLSVLADLGILVDRDEEGYLLQLFTKPVGVRPTLFLEIIQRKGATSFGKGNFKALFEAIEREQKLRGTL